MLLFQLLLEVSRIRAVHRGVSGLCSRLRLYRTWHCGKFRSWGKLCQLCGTILAPIKEMLCSLRSCAEPVLLPLLHRAAHLTCTTSCTITAWLKGWPLVSSQSLSKMFKSIMLQSEFMPMLYPCIGRFISHNLCLWCTTHRATPPDTLKRSNTDCFDLCSYAVLKISYKLLGQRILLMLLWLDCMQYMRAQAGATGLCDILIITNQTVTTQVWCVD